MFNTETRIRDEKEATKKRLVFGITVGLTLAGIGLVIALYLGTMGYDAIALGDHDLEHGPESDENAHRVCWSLQGTDSPCGRLIVRVLHHDGSPAGVPETERTTGVPNGPRQEHDEPVIYAYPVAGPEQFLALILEERSRMPVRGSPPVKCE